MEIAFAVLLILAGLAASALVFVLLGVVGILLARLPGCAWKLLLVFLSIMPAFLMIAVGWPPRLGLDLAGGVCLVYKTEPAAGAATGTPTNVDMDELIAAVARRVNPGSMRDIGVRSYGDGQIEIVADGTMPTAENIHRRLAAARTLEFRILANNHDHDDLIQRALDSDQQEIRNGQGEWLVRWVPIDKKVADDFRPEAGESLESFHGGAGGIATRDVGDEEGKKTLTVLVVNDQFDVNGSYLDSVRPAVDDRGRPCIDFAFDSTGSQLFGGLTGSNLPDPMTKFARRLAVILDGRVHSAPNIQSTIFKRGQITGNFTQPEVTAIVDCLKAGSLPCGIQPVSETTIGANAGAARNVGVVAAVGVGALLLSLLTLTIGYRLVGLAASMAWTLEVLFLLAVLMFLRTVVTLPGVLALLMALGLAAGCNLLVCVLVRGQRRGGAEPTEAARTGFREGLTPVFTVRLLAYLTGMLLYIVGADVARGVGIVISTGSLVGLYTSFFCFPALLEAAGRLVRNATPSNARLLFPGTPPPSGAKPPGYAP